MLLSMFFLACLDYNLDAKVKTALPADTGILDDSSDITVDTATDTGVVDTGYEEPVVEEVDPEIAQAKIYANTSGELYEVNPDSGELLYIGAFMENGEPVDHFEDIAIDLSGHMYGGTGEYLYLINPTTAQVRSICPLDIATTALTFTSRGELILGVDSTLYKLNVQTCALQVLIANSFYETSGDIVGLPDGYLYWSVRGGNADHLIKVDPNTGIEEWVGNIGESRLYGMGYANDILFGFSGSGRIVRIDPNTGSSSFFKQLDTVSWWGATTNPVLWD